MEAQYMYYCFFNVVRTVPSNKQLGLTFSDNLKWSLQLYVDNIENIVKKHKKQKQKQYNEETKTKQNKKQLKKRNKKRDTSSYF